MSDTPDFAALLKRAGLKIYPKTLDADFNVIECSLEQAAEDWASGKWALFKDETAQGHLSTAFLGQLFSPVCYFETMLFSDNGDTVQNRYETYAEAKSGHEELKKRLG